MSSQIIPVEPFDYVVFGGTGDLAERKLLPALYHRQLAGQLSDPTRIIGASRTAFTDEEYRKFAVDALKEGLVGPVGRGQGLLATEIAARPEVRAAMPRGMLVTKDGTRQADLAQQIERQRVVADLGPRPEGAQHPGIIVAEQERVQRIGNPLIERSEIVAGRRPGVIDLAHHGGDLENRVLAEAARPRLAAESGQGRQTQVPTHLADELLGQHRLRQVADAARRRLHEVGVGGTNAEGALARRLAENHAREIGGEALDDRASRGHRRRGSADGVAAQPPPHR